MLIYCFGVGHRESQEHESWHEDQDGIIQLGTGQGCGNQTGLNCHRMTTVGQSPMALGGDPFLCSSSSHQAVLLTEMCQQSCCAQSQ